MLIDRIEPYLVEGVRVLGIHKSVFTIKVLPKSQRHSHDDPVYRNPKLFGLIRDILLAPNRCDEAQVGEKNPDTRSYRFTGEDMLEKNGIAIPNDYRDALVVVVAIALSRKEKERWNHQNCDGYTPTYFLLERNRDVTPFAGKDIKGMRRRR